MFACTPNVTVKHNSLHKFPFAESKDLINEEKRKLKVLECSKRVSDEVLRKQTMMFGDLKTGHQNQDESSFKMSLILRIDWKQHETIAVLRGPSISNIDTSQW